MRSNCRLIRRIDTVCPLDELALEDTLFRGSARGAIDSTETSRITVKHRPGLELELVDATDENKDDVGGGLENDEDGSGKFDKTGLKGGDCGKVDVELA